MLIWPVEHLWPSSLLWTIQEAATSEPTVNGRPFVTLINGGAGWRCEMTVSLVDADLNQLRAARALVSKARGGLTSFIVPSLDIGLRAYAMGAPETAPHSDETPFSDDTEYGSDAIRVFLAEDAGDGAAQITVRAEVAGTLISSEFSYTHATMGRRMYLVEGVTATGNPNEYVLDINPPWREAADAMTDGEETRLDFDNPGCTMTLANAPEAMAALKPPVLGELTLVFEEAE